MQIKVSQFPISPEPTIDNILIVRFRLRSHKSAMKSMEISLFRQHRLRWLIMIVFENLIQEANYRTCYMSITFTLHIKSRVVAAAALQLLSDMINVSSRIQRGKKCGKSRLSRNGFREFCLMSAHN